MAVAPPGGRPAAAPRCMVREDAGTVEIDTGVAVFRLGKGGGVLPQIRLGGRSVLAPETTGVFLTDARDRPHAPRVETIACEAAGPVRASVCLTGTFPGPAPCRFVARLDAFAVTG